MRYLSTRGQSPAVDAGQALQDGLAPDGGLYVPEQWPLSKPELPSAPTSLADTATALLTPFFQGSALENSLSGICQSALDLPLPLVEIDPDQTWMLELFHGPTAAFKDFAARFLAACMAALKATETPLQTVLVATSGDTGSAVAAAFHQRPGFRVVILYPEGRVSARQAHQLGAFGDNVQAYCVKGNFDDCQALVKRALNDTGLAQKLALTSANSISIGRLLPQISYYAHTSTQLAASGHAPVDIIVPTGNLGNALAAILARDLGLPIGEIVLATNANPTLVEFFRGEEYLGRPGIETLANAMDVGDPSNFERLAWFYRSRNLRQSAISAVAVDDATIQQRIRQSWQDRQLALCPHTACAMEALEQRRQSGINGPHLVAATAHPAKFEGVVEPLIGQPITPPPALAELLQRPSQAESLPATYEALVERLLDGLAA